MKWMKTPVLVLDKPQTLALLETGWTPNLLDGMNRWHVKSQWLCDELNEQEKSGYVYNAQALHQIEKQEGIGPFDENGSVLSILIYNAQGYRPVINPDGSAFVLAPRSRTKGFRADGQAAARLSTE